MSTSSREGPAPGHPAEGQQRLRSRHGRCAGRLHSAAQCRLPLVCLDETSKQLIAETRTPIPMKRGRAARIDYEYERNGTSNLFMLFAPLEGWRHVEVTDRHTAVYYAHVLKDLADRHFPHAKTIVLVQDNLNIHSKASLYEAFTRYWQKRKLLLIIHDRAFLPKASFLCDVDGSQ
jgi:hypothetical protein